MTQTSLDKWAPGDGVVSEAVREANKRIGEKAIRLHFVSRVPFVCECSDPACLEFVLLNPNEYAERSRRGFVTLPGHATRKIEDRPYRPARRG
jgi:hypothetical protein